MVIIRKFFFKFFRKSIYINHATCKKKSFAAILTH